MTIGWRAKARDDLSTEYIVPDMVESLEMPRGDDLDAFISRRTALNPEFPKLVEAALETRRLVLELAAERERQGLSQERVAEALGTKQPNIARLERGAVDPKHTTLVRYAALLGKRIGLQPIQPAKSGNGRDRKAAAS
jgi:DNA-binding XRE family transcriptional regulator